MDACVFWAFLGQCSPRKQMLVFEFTDPLERRISARISKKRIFARNFSFAPFETHYWLVECRKVSYARDFMGKPHKKTHPVLSIFFFPLCLSRQIRNRYRDLASRVALGDPRGAATTTYGTPSTPLQPPHRRGALCMRFLS
jgi:hypothetical protein